MLGIIGMVYIRNYGRITDVLKHVLMNSTQIQLIIIVYKHKYSYVHIDDVYTNQ